MEKPQLIFIGAPGSGKGTQAKYFEKQFGYKHLSTGDILRGEIKKHSEIGKQVDSILKAGELVNDTLMKSVLSASLNLREQIYILDGYPRTLPQAENLDSLLGDSIAYQAVFFKLELEQLVHRLSNRRICKNCGAIYNLTSNPPGPDGKCVACGGYEIIQRADDQEDIIKQRIQIYLNNIGPVVDYYRKKSQLVEIAVDDEATNVSARLEELLNLKA